MDDGLAGWASLWHKETNSVTFRYLLISVQESECQLTDLCGEPPPGHVLGPDCLLDAVHLLLVALAVPHGVLLRLLQGVLKGFNSLGRGTQTLLQLWQLAAKICVVPNQLRAVEESDK